MSDITFSDGQQQVGHLLKVFWRPVLIPSFVAFPYIVLIQKETDLTSFQIGLQLPVDLTTFQTGLQLPVTVIYDNERMLVRMYVNNILLSCKYGIITILNM